MSSNFGAVALLLAVFLMAEGCDSCRASDGSGDRRDGSVGPRTEAVGIGVATCDDYLAKYAACVVSHVPGDKKKTFEDNLARMQASWKALAANPGARPGLAQMCGLALETARTSMQQYNCTW
jgi:hypothetical protein